MLIDIAEFLACLVECVIITGFLINYFSFRNHKNYLFKVFCIGLTMMISEIIVTYTNFSEIIGVSAFIIPFSILAHYWLKGKFFEKILISMLCYIAVITINMTVLSVFSSVTSEEYISLIKNPTLSRILILCITKIILFIILYFSLYFRANKKINLKTSEWLLIICIFVTTISVSLALREILHNSVHTKTFFIFIGFCMVILNIIVCLFMMKISARNKRDSDIELLNFQIFKQESDMIKNNRDYNEIIKIKHDMKNYIQCATALLKDKQYSQLETYLNNFSDIEIGSINKYISTENAILNSVINSKLSMAEHKNISFDYQITGNTGEIDDIDFGVLLGNLLDNAIEACEKNQIESKIYIDMCNKESYLHLRITNTYNDKILGEKLSLKTTKSNSKYHGLGLKSVQDTVKKYNGVSCFEVKNSKFIASIMLCLKK